MNPLNYIVKAGAATLAELSALKRSNPADVETLRGWAIAEMDLLGIAHT